MNFTKENYEFQYLKGIKYTDIVLPENFKIMYYDDKYTGKVETDFVDDLDFFDKNTLIHVYGKMQDGVLTAVWAEAQFSDNTMLALRNSLSTVLNKLNEELQFRPYRKFM